MAQNDKKFYLTLYLRNCISYDSNFWYPYVKWFLQQIFSSLQKSDFSGFFKNHQQMPTGNSEVCPTSLWCVSFFVKLWLIFVPVGVIKDRITTIENCDHTICPVLSILFIWPSQYGLAFWKVYLWARSFYSFKNHLYSGKAGNIS